jgi:hypothetical protein
MDRSTRFRFLELHYNHLAWLYLISTLSYISNHPLNFSRTLSYTSNSLDNISSTHLATSHPHTELYLNSIDLLRYEYASSTHLTTSHPLTWLHLIHTLCCISSTHLTTYRTLSIHPVNYRLYSTSPDPVSRNSETQPHVFVTYILWQHISIWVLHSCLENVKQSTRVSPCALELNG